MPFTAVLDTCVLVPAGLRDTLLRFAAADLFRPVWSDDIMGELQRNVEKLVGATPRQFQRLEREMDRSFPDARSTGYQRYVPVLEVHEKDRHVLALAIATRADAIITENVKDFTAAACDPIEVLTADTFLVQRFDLDPVAAVRALIEQAAALTSPPMTLDEVLARLAARVPNLVSRARQELTGST